jgi:hypothetical protein
LIGLLEIISLIFGHFLSGALDAHLEHYDALTSGNIGQALHYLNIGRIPALIVLCLLAGFFGLFGILLQHGWVTLWQAPLSNLLLAPVSFILAVFAVHYSGKIIAPGCRGMKPPPSLKMNLSAAWRLLPDIPQVPEPLRRQIYR